MTPSITSKLTSQQFLSYQSLSRENYYTHIWLFLLHEHENELPVYYYGRGFADLETRYPDNEKLALALIIAAHKLRQYFQTYTIHVLTNHPLRQILQKPETSGRMVKWAIELGEFDLHLKPRIVIKGQAAAYFIVEFIHMNHDNPNPEAPPPPGCYMGTPCC